MKKKPQKIKVILYIKKWTYDHACIYLYRNSYLDNLTLGEAWADAFFQFTVFKIL